MIEHRMPIHTCHSKLTLISVTRVQQAFKNQRTRAGWESPILNEITYFTEISTIETEKRSKLLMGREKDRKLRRRKRRQAKLRVLKNKLGQTKDQKARQELIQKINKISFYPMKDGPR